MSEGSHKKGSNPVVQYFVDSFEEFGKITWPTKEQAVMLTGIVVVVCAISAVLLASLDLGLSESYQLLLKSLSSSSS